MPLRIYPKSESRDNTDLLQRQITFFPVNIADSKQSCTFAAKHNK